MDDATLKYLLDQMDLESKRGYDAGGEHCLRCGHCAMSIPPAGGWAQQRLACVERTVRGNEVSAVEIPTDGPLLCEGRAFTAGQYPVRAMRPVRWEIEALQARGLPVDRMLRSGAKGEEHIPNSSE